MVQTLNALLVTFFLQATVWQTPCADELDSSLTQKNSQHSSAQTLKDRLTFQDLHNTKEDVGNTLSTSRDLRSERIAGAYGWDDYVKRARLMSFHGMRGRRDRENMLPEKSRVVRNFQAIRGKRKSELEAFTGDKSSTEEQKFRSLQAPEVSEIHKRPRNLRIKRHVFGQRISSDRTTTEILRRFGSPQNLYNVQSRASNFHGLRGKRQEEAAGMHEREDSRDEGSFDDPWAAAAEEDERYLGDGKWRDDSPVRFAVPAFLGSSFFEGLSKADQVFALQAMIELCARHNIDCSYSHSMAGDEEASPYLRLLKRRPSFSALRGKRVVTS